MASNLEAMASNLEAMASHLLAKAWPPTSHLLAIAANLMQTRKRMLRRDAH